MKIHFFGAAREVTGTCYLLETGDHRVLVDCGMFQGGREIMLKNHDPFPFKPQELDAVFLTHSHMDHVGRAPMLVKRGYRGRIYATAPTVDLAKLLWEDMLHLMEEERKRDDLKPLYDDRDVAKAAEKLGAVSYHQALGLCAGAIEASFHDAGHILGSAFIKFRAEGRTMVFSGDLGNDDEPILKPVEPLGEADALVIESTYGDRVHEDRTTRVQILRDLVKETVAKKGTLVIPAFAIERTQEIILTLHHLAESGEIPRVPVFLDSPLAIAATHVFEEHPDYYNAEARKEMLMGHEIFSLPGLTAAKTVEMSKMINDVVPPKIIIAGAGMMTGGRIHHHLMRYLPDPNSAVMIVGYQAGGTVGRQLYEGAKQVRIHKEDVPVRARIVAVGGWSAHADQKKLLSWAGEWKSRPEVILVTHGEPNAAETLARKFNRDLKIPAYVPEPGQVYEFKVNGARRG